jgi:hypothetical protein
MRITVAVAALLVFIAMAAASRVFSRRAGVFEGAG